MSSDTMSLNQLNAVLSNATIGKDRVYLNRKNEVQVCKAGGIFSSIKWHVLNAVGYYNSNQTAVASKVSAVVIRNVLEISKISPDTAQSLISKFKELKKLSKDSEVDADLGLAITMIYNVKKPENKPQPDVGLKIQQSQWEDEKCSILETLIDDVELFEEYDSVTLKEEADFERNCILFGEDYAIERYKQEGAIARLK